MNQLSYYGMTTQAVAERIMRMRISLNRKEGMSLQPLRMESVGIRAVRLPPVLPVSASPIICGTLRKRLWERMY